MKIPAQVGLCWDCRWSRRIQSAKGSEFFFCRRSETDPAYPKYPPLPVRACPGYEPPTISISPKATGVRD